MRAIKQGDELAVVLHTSRIELTSDVVYGAQQPRTSIPFIAISVSFVIFEADNRFAVTTSFNRGSNSWARARQRGGAQVRTGRTAGVDMLAGRGSGQGVERTTVSSQKKVSA